ncbi:NADPH-dependent F420 reductase, partial [Streptomyces anandii]
GQYSAKTAQQGVSQTPSHDRRNLSISINVGPKCDARAFGAYKRRVRDRHAAAPGGDRMGREGLDPTSARCPDGKARALPLTPARSEGSNLEINIVGPGNMGRAIAARALTGGHSVCLVHPDADRGRAAAAELKQRFPDGETGSATAAQAADMTVLALLYNVTLEVAGSARAMLSGQVVVDICNPVDFATMDSRVTPADTSAAEQIQQVVGTDAKVVKAFNTTFAGLLTTGEGHGFPLDVLIAGDNSPAKAKVAELISSGAMRPLDVGPLRRARELEALGFLHISVQQPLGLNWHSHQDPPLTEPDGPVHPTLPSQPKARRSSGLATSLGHRCHRQATRRRRLPRCRQTARPPLRRS